MICHFLACIQTPLPTGKIKEVASVSHLNLNKLFPPTKNSVAHVSCHSSSRNVGACNLHCILIEQLRERERFLKLVYSIPSKKNVLASPY